MNWLKYSGATLAITLNPFHWGFQFRYNKSADVWEKDAFIVQFGPISFRAWIDDGQW